MEERKCPYEGYDDDGNLPTCEVAGQQEVRAYGLLSLANGKWYDATCPLSGSLELQRSCPAFMRFMLEYKAGLIVNQEVPVE